MPRAPRPRAPPAAALRPQDLNALMQCEDRACAHQRGDVEVWFADIAGRMAQLFGATPYVVGAMAWFHDKSVLKALEQCRGVSFVITSERGCGRYHAARFGALRPFQAADAGRSAVRAVGRATGRRRALMHHKFAVGLDADRQPVWVLTGSYNPTQHSRLSTENALLLRRPEVAEVYFREYARLYGISRHVRCAAR